MLQLRKKLKLYTEMGPETAHKNSLRNLFMIICRLPAPSKVFLQLEHHTESMLHP